MPDVNLFYARRLTNGGQFPNNVSPRDLMDSISSIVAEQMDCLDDDGVLVTHDPQTQISIVQFAPITGRSTKLIILQIYAYDHPNRMFDIKQRMTKISATIRDLLDLGPGTVDSSFVPIPVGGWANA